MGVGVGVPIGGIGVAGALQATRVKASPTRHSAARNVSRSHLDLIRLLLPFSLTAVLSLVVSLRCHGSPDGPAKRDSSPRCG